MNTVWSDQISKKHTVSIIQTNTFDDEKYSNPHGIILSLISDIKHSDSDFIFTSEAAFPASLDQIGLEFDDLNDHLLNTEQNLIAGSSTLVNLNPRRELSSLVGVGYSRGIYHKVHPIPFIESWPNNFIFNQLNLEPISFSVPYRGDQSYIKSHVKAHSYKISSNICYEALIPNYIRDNSHLSNLIFISSNTNTLGFGYLQDHLFVSSRFRAIENGKYAVIANNSGFSAVVDHRGTVLSRTNLNERTTLKSYFYFMEGRTPFNMLGHLPLLILSFIVILSLSIRNNKK